MLIKSGFAVKPKVLTKRMWISLEKLAELTEAHFTQVSRYERAVIKPNAEAMIKLVMGLDITDDFLINGTAIYGA